MAEGSDEYLTPHLAWRLRGYFADRSATAGDGPLPRGQRILLTSLTRMANLLSPASIGRGEGPFNDTIWRTVLDVYRAVRTATRAGDRGSAPVRTIFTLVDGLIAGQRNGPLRPRPARLGLLVAGRDPYAVDLAVARLAGFDAGLIRYLTHFPPDLSRVVPAAVSVLSNSPDWNGQSLAKCRPRMTLTPPDAWLRSHRIALQRKECPFDAGRPPQNVIR